MTALPAPGMETIPLTVPSNTARTGAPLPDCISIPLFFTMMPLSSLWGCSPKVPVMVPCSTGQGNSPLLPLKLLLSLAASGVRVKTLALVTFFFPAAVAFFLAASISLRMIFSIALSSFFLAACLSARSLRSRFSRSVRFLRSLSCSLRSFSRVDFCVCSVLRREVFSFLRCSSSVFLPESTCCVPAISSACRRR